MKTVKPFRLSLLTRPYRWQQRDTLGVSVLAMVSLGADPRLMPEQELWQTVSEELDPGSALDLGVPKRVPEVLASGFCYTAHQQDKTMGAVELQVAGLQKSLAVFGDRYWLDGRATAAQPFEQMRVDWRHAYGGPAVAENPLGIGSVVELVNGVQAQRLPNVEWPGAQVRSPNDAVRPAGFAGLLPDWPQRMALVGTDFGKEWLEHDAPGFARDMDWQFFNAAPADQRWPDLHELPPGAPYAFRNMHPRHAVLQGRLPEWKARCFASFHPDGSDLREAPLRLTTAWFFPHLERAVLVWHGGFEIAQDDAADVHHVMPALELPDAPRPLSHYQAVLARRLDPAMAVHVLRDSDLAPKAVLGEWEAAQMADPLARPTARNMRAGQQREYEARHAELTAAGLDPALYLPQPPSYEPLPGLDDMVGYVERAGEQIEASVHARKALEAENAERMAQAGFNADIPGEPVRQRFDPDALVREIERAEVFERETQGEGSADGATPMFSADDKARMIDRARQGYLHAAHLSAPAAPASTFRSAKLRRRLGAAPAGQRSFAGMNLIGADLHGMDLRGANFAGAMLEDANLDGAQLDDCDFSNAVLARATLARTSLARANFDGANLGSARCEASVFTGASFRDTLCDKASFQACLLDEAVFERTRWHESSLDRCDLRRSRWLQVAILKLTLAGIAFDDASFSHMAWIECRFEGVSFARASFTQCGFSSTDASHGVDFSDATLNACSFSGASTLAHARFAGASLKQCGLRGTVLSQADFGGARLEGCDFSSCDLRAARLERMAAGESLFVRADFTGASLRGANLIDANLSKATLASADLRGANLFRADVSQALIDTSTLLDGAYVQQAKTVPRRHVEDAA